MEVMEFEAGPTMATPRAACASVQLDAERVLVVGGVNNNSALATSEILAVIGGSALRNQVTFYERCAALA